jgi:hypothetical protein
MAGIYNSLARANGWGSAGSHAKCPAPVRRAKTPAAGELVSRVAAARVASGATSASVTLPRGGVA